MKGLGVGSLEIRFVTKKKPRWYQAPIIKAINGEQGNDWLPFYRNVSGANYTRMAVITQQIFNYLQFSTSILKLKLIIFNVVKECKVYKIKYGLTKNSKLNKYCSYNLKVFFCCSKTIHIYNFTKQVAFVGRTGPNHLGDIAIDDISLKPELCPYIPPTTTTPAPTTIAETTVEMTTQPTTQQATTPQPTTTVATTTTTTEVLRKLSIYVF